MIDHIKQDHISRLVIRGYKSIVECDLKMTPLNVLIGANGAGKSNLISFFRLISRVLDQQLQATVGNLGGPDALLHFGRKKTEQLCAELYFGYNGYKFSLQPTQDNRLMFSRECLWWNKTGDSQINSGHFETYFDRKKGSSYVIPAMRTWRIYHFHDTSQSALVKQIHGINDNEYLRDDARNLASFLYRLKTQHEAYYKRIVKSVQLVAPFFGDFHLRPTVNNQEKIQLEWTEVGQDIPFTASALSDGTLRFICLATVLLQPEQFMPSAILIDEPELGLHPYAITILAALMKSAAQQHQLIISTQSVELVSEFEAKNLIVVDKIDGASRITRLDTEKLSEWLEEYILGGRPNR